MNGGSELGGASAGNGRKGDRGACCYTSAAWENFNKITTGTNQEGLDFGVVLFNKFTCPAKFILGN
jgi:hypothetical protein